MDGTLAVSNRIGRAHRWELGWVCVVFVLSGFAALLYQVSWQRALFAVFGINIEAVTVVVTAFMLGLGVGSLLGGVLSKSRDQPVLIYFAAIEGSIGLFGLSSLSLFEWVGKLTLHASAVITAGASFLLVLVPTILMGATLPLLVAHAVRHTGSVGRSVGMLYFVNTLDRRWPHFWPCSPGCRAGVSGGRSSLRGHQSLGGLVRHALYRLGRRPA